MLIRSVRSVRDPLSYDLGYHSSSHGSIGSIMACATSTNSSSSTLSSCDTCLIRSITILALKTTLLLCNWLITFYNYALITTYKSIFKLFAILISLFNFKIIIPNSIITSTLVSILSSHLYYNRSIY